MKKINLLLASVLFCTLVSAHGIDGPKRESSVAVTNVSGSSLFKVYYKSLRPESVKILISDEKGAAVFSETLKKVDGFMRPYNFETLPKGQYTIQIESESGRTVEKINYDMDKAEKLVNVLKLANEENKYLLTIAASKTADIYINIYDASGTLVHNEVHSIKGEFAQMFDLSDVKSFTLEVADKDGVVKSVTY